jgi:hypothetical protein
VIDGNKSVTRESHLFDVFEKSLDDTAIDDEGRESSNVRSHASVQLGLFTYSFRLYYSDFLPDSWSLLAT